MKRQALAFAAGLLATACNPVSSDTALTNDTLQDLRIKDLEQKVASLQKDRDRFDYWQTARLIPSEKGYSNLVTDAGTFAVTFEDVQPYADGSRVRVKFGNLTNATITELRVTIRWGSANDKQEFEGAPRVDVWRKLDGPFPPGKWKEETIDLAGVPPAKLGKIELADGSVNKLTLLRD